MSLSPSTRSGIMRQDRIARRYGLTVLTGSISIFLASVILTVCLHVALDILSAGALDVPQDVRLKAEKLQRR